MFLNSVEPITYLSTLNSFSPVINTKKALDNIESGTVTTIVDNVISRDNMVMFAKNLGYSVAIEQQGTEYHITITKGKTDQPTSSATPSTGWFFL